MFNKYTELEKAFYYSPMFEYLPLTEKAAFLEAVSGSKSGFFIRGNYGCFYNTGLPAAEETASAAEGEGIVIKDLYASAAYASLESIVNEKAAEEAVREAVKEEEEAYREAAAAAAAADKEAAYLTAAAHLVSEEAAEAEAEASRKRQIKKDASALFILSLYVMVSAAFLAAFNMVSRGGIFTAAEAAFLLTAVSSAALLMLPFPVSLAAVKAAEAAAEEAAYQVIKWEVKAEAAAEEAAYLTAAAAYLVSAAETEAYYYDSGICYIKYLPDYAYTFSVIADMLEVLRRDSLLDDTAYCEKEAELMREDWLCYGLSSVIDLFNDNDIEAYIIDILKEAAEEEEEALPGERQGERETAYSLLYSLMSDFSFYPHIESTGSFFFPVSDIEEAAAAAGFLPEEAVKSIVPETIIEAYASAAADTVSNSMDYKSREAAASYETAYCGSRKALPEAAAETASAAALSEAVKALIKAGIVPAAVREAASSAAASVIEAAAAAAAETAAAAAETAVKEAAYLIVESHILTAEEKETAAEKAAAYIAEAGNYAEAAAVKAAVSIGLLTAAAVREAASSAAEAVSSGLPVF